MALSLNERVIYYKEGDIIHCRICGGFKSPSWYWCERKGILICEKCMFTRGGCGVVYYDHQDVKVKGFEKIA